MVSTPTTDDIYALLKQVNDPEIPTVSVVDLGIITEVRVDKETGVFVEMVPTFAGCPAVQLMRLEIESVLDEAGIQPYEVSVNHNRPWSSNNVSEEGRKNLLEFGLSPPPAYSGELDDGALEHAICPNCHSTETTLLSPFGPTLCRAIHQCKNCQETFEQFKPV